MAADNALMIDRIEAAVTIAHLINEVIAISLKAILRKDTIVIPA